MTIPVITVIGHSGAGKTTLITKLIGELRARGYRIGTIKHHSHAGFDIDKPGKDSWQHAQAGSEQVVIASPDKIAMYKLLDQELELDEILPLMQDLDLILVEGFRAAQKPSIEVVHDDHKEDLISDHENIIAVVGNQPIAAPFPHFKSSDIPAIADLIESLFLNR